MVYYQKYILSLTNMKKIILVGLFLSTYSLFAHGMDEGHVTQFIQGGPLDFIYIGAIHMVTGYDHILFLVGVIFFLATVKDIFKFITVFTLGHSITLIGATLLGWQMNYFLIDAVIGFSVFLLNSNYRVKMEEVYLARTFGDKYAQYMDHAGRYFPKMNKFDNS